MTVWTQPSIFEIDDIPQVDTARFYCDNCRAIVPRKDKPLHVIDAEFTKEHAPPHSGWTYHIAQRIALGEYKAALNAYSQGLISWDALVTKYRRAYEVWNAREGYLIDPAWEVGVSWAALSRSTRKKFGCWLVGARTIRPDVGGMTRYYCLCGAEYRTEKALNEHLRSTT